MNSAHRITLGVVAFCSALLSACVSSDGTDAYDSRGAEEKGAARDFNVAYDYGSCEHHIVVFGVPRERLDAYLKTRTPAPGWKSRPATGRVLTYFPPYEDRETYEDSGQVVALFHPCGSGMSGTAQSDWFFWIPVTDPGVADDLPQAGVHWYQIRQYSRKTDDSYRVYENALGDELWGASMTTTGITGDEATGFSVHSEMAVDGKPVFTMDVQDARRVPGMSLTGHLNLYSVVDAGLMIIATGYDEGDLIPFYVGTGSCWMDPEHPLVEVLGTTDCMDPDVLSVYFLQRTHDHGLGSRVVWDEGWDGGSIVVTEETPWYDND